MPIVVENLGWMFFNIALAFIGVGFAYLFLGTKKGLLKLLFFILWLLFLPNTIYLLTDLQYLPEQFMKVNSADKFILVFEYLSLLILGIFTFMFGINPIEKKIKKEFKKDKTAIVLSNIAINFTISFGVVLGKVERVHSWYVFTDPKGVIESSIRVLSDQGLVILIFSFGVIINIVFFYFKKFRVFKFR